MELQHAGWLNHQGQPVPYKNQFQQQKTKKKEV